MPQLLSTDVVCFARDTNGDLIFPLRGASGLEAIGIGIRERLLLFQGEWFLNLDAGVPWLPTADNFVTEDAAILGQAFNEIKVRAAVLHEILSVPGVFDVPTLFVGFDDATRTLTVSWTARTLFGDTPLDTIARNLP